MKKVSIPIESILEVELDPDAELYVSDIKAGIRTPWLSPGNRIHP